MKLIDIKKSSKPDKKLMAVFDEGGKQIVRHFGQAGADDFTKTKNDAQKALYIARHKKNENWNDPTTPGALSRYILWNKPTVTESVADYKKRFNI